jgi:hypothetical protein
MFKQKHYLALGAVTLVTVLIFSLPRARLPTSNSPSAAVSAAVRPGQHRATIARPTCRHDVLPRRELLRKLKLRRENQRLEVQALQAAATARENDQLRARWHRLAATNALETETRQRRHARPGQLVAHRSD